MDVSRLDRPRFGVLGPLQVIDGQGSPVALGGRRTRELLAVLLLHPMQTVSTERLVDCLWGETATDGAFTTLRTYVGQVRRLLAAIGPGEVLVTRGGGYALLVDPSDVDAEVFDRLVHRGQEALALGGDPGRARASLAAALDLWRGDVLADLGTPAYAEAFSAGLHERRADAWEALMDSELALGRHPEVVATLRSLVTTYPYRERFTAQLVLALYRCGRQADALMAYNATKHRLADELGLDPSPELRDLQSAVLRQDPLLACAPSTPDPTSAGQSRPTATLPDAVLAALRRTTMVGRDQQLDRLVQAWRTTCRAGSATALISGSAGVGKSRLMAELAGEAADGGASVLVGRCEEVTVPYQPLALALEASTEVTQTLERQPAGLKSRLAPLLWSERPHAAEEQSPSQAERVALWRSTCALLGALAADRPLLVVVDDADRVDEASALLLRYLVLHLPARVMLVICYRDPPGSGHPPLATLLGDAAVIEVADRLEVPSLSEGQLRELVAQVTGIDPQPWFVRRLHAHTAGNPFFAAQVLRGFGGSSPSEIEPWSTVPTGVRDVLRQRLAGLPDATREALAAAAVLGIEMELVDLSSPPGHAGGRRRAGAGSGGGGRVHGGSRTVLGRRVRVSPRAHARSGLRRDPPATA